MRAQVFRNQMYVQNCFFSNEYINVNYSFVQMQIMAQLQNVKAMNCVPTDRLWSFTIIKNHMKGFLDNMRNDVNRWLSYWEWKTKQSVFRTVFAHVFMLHLFTVNAVWIRAPSCRKAVDLHAMSVLTQIAVFPSSLANLFLRNFWVHSLKCVSWTFCFKTYFVCVYRLSEQAKHNCDPSILYAYPGHGKYPHNVS